jgi:hypothetical protein
MKTDLTHLSLADQITAVMGVLHRRAQSGAKVTHSSDLLRACKHHGFRTPTQRLAHFTNLHRVASKALCGENPEALIKDMERNAVIFEVGDEAMHEGERVRIVDLIDDGRLANIRRPSGTLDTVSTVELTPPTVAGN